MWPFKKEKQKEIEKIELPQEERKKGAEVIFSVIDGKVNVEIYWYAKPEEEDEVSLDFGQLLSDINSGTYVESIFDIFSEFVEENPEEKEFVSNTILVWNEVNIIKQEQIQKELTSSLTTKEPLVRPLKVFRQSGIFKE